MEIVNGYVCHNCTDTELAAKNIDPAHPKDGPFGQDKKDAAGQPVNKPGEAHGPAVRLDGRLAGADPVTRPDGVTAAQATAPGGALDLSV